jgi:hypothetical protein
MKIMVKADGVGESRQSVVLADISDVAAVLVDILEHAALAKIHVGAELFGHRRVLVTQARDAQQRKNLWGRPSDRYFTTSGSGKSGAKRQAENIRVKRNIVGVHDDRELSYRRESLC